MINGNGQLNLKSSVAYMHKYQAYSHAVSISKVQTFGTLQFRNVGKLWPTSSLVVKWHFYLSVEFRLRFIQVYFFLRLNLNLKFASFGFR